VPEDENHNRLIKKYNNYTIVIFSKIYSLSIKITFNFMLSNNIQSKISISDYKKNKNYTKNRIFP